MYIMAYTCIYFLVLVYAMYRLGIYKYMRLGIYKYMHVHTEYSQSTY